MKDIDLETYALRYSGPFRSKHYRHGHDTSAYLRYEQCPYLNSVSDAKFMTVAEPALKFAENWYNNQYFQTELDIWFWPEDKYTYIQFIVQFVNGDEELEKLTIQYEDVGLMGYDNHYFTESYYRIDPKFNHPVLTIVLYFYIDNPIDDMTPPEAFRAMLVNVFKEFNDWKDEEVANYNNKDIRKLMDKPTKCLLEILATTNNKIILPIISTNCNIYGTDVKFRTHTSDFLFSCDYTEQAIDTIYGYGVVRDYAYILASELERSVGDVKGAYVLYYDDKDDPSKDKEECEKNYNKSKESYAETYKPIYRAIDELFRKAKLDEK